MTQISECCVIIENCRARALFSGLVGKVEKKNLRTDKKLFLFMAFYLVSKETVVLRRWGSETRKFGLSTELIM